LNRDDLTLLYSRPSGESAMELALGWDACIEVSDYYRREGMNIALEKSGARIGMTRHFCTDVLSESQRGSWLSVGTRV
jgi:hypothetical protein